nr:uncharacterized protein LOC126056492 [Helicoverpa armigera]
MTIFLFFLLATAVIGRPNEESINDLERIVYLDGSGKSIARSTNTGKTNDLNNYSDARRNADSPTSSVKPIEKPPADTYPIATADEIDPNEKYAVARFNSPLSHRQDRASGLGGTNRVNADRISNIDKKTHRNLNDVRSLKNNLHKIFTGIDTFSRGKLPKKTSLDDSESVVREGQNQDAENNTVSVIELDNDNKSATVMPPEETGEGIDVVPRYQIPLSESTSASHCHCGTINGHRKCTCN